MICDKLENSHLYKLGKRFDLAFEYLKNTDLTALEKGKYEISGIEVVVQVNEYQTKNQDQIKWEAHRHYADIQVLVSGSEKIGFANLDHMIEEEPYNPEKDVAFYRGTGDSVTVHPKYFVVFFPHDAHQPGIHNTQITMVKKIVVKVSMEA